ncbi:MAG: hypothetical protein R3F56_22745 [Planctomycetota bacterium]
MTFDLDDLRRRAPWLFAEALGACIVGSTALAEACRRAGVPGPRAQDVDFAWALDPDGGEALLRQHGLYCATTPHNRARGTLAFKLDGDRFEITTLRGDAPAGASLQERIELDLTRRDMTVGALAWRLGDDVIVDPLGGLEDWRAGRVVACGDPAERVAEHAVRLLRYYRRTHEWGFELEPRIRRLRADPHLLAQVPAEAVSAELRAALLRCASPGRFFVELSEVGALQAVAPELAPQFDGRPAGPLRHHPEVSQALHLLLALEWAASRSRGLGDSDRLAVMTSVLVHDLGKNTTPSAEWPSHHGHEHAGLPLIDAFFERLPSLGDARARRLARAVCALHLTARALPELRPGTLATLYEDWFKWNAFPVDLFALAVAADLGGRLDAGNDGERALAQVTASVHWLRDRCGSVDAAALWQRHHGDRAAFARALHEERARALRQRA